MMKGIKMEQLSALAGNKEMPMKMEIEPIEGDESNLAMSVLDEVESILNEQLIPALQKIKSKKPEGIENE